MVRFVTNTTKDSQQTLHNRLTKTIGFHIEQSEIYSSLSAAVDYVKSHKLNPFYLLSDDAVTDFPKSVDNKYDSVVVGLAPERFNYENLTSAFNILRSHPNLIAIHEGRYYKREDGLALGPGCFTRGLEYSTGVKAVVVGKPNEHFFRAAIPAGCIAEECVMIGDVSEALHKKSLLINHLFQDINDDIEGSMRIGMKGVLVKTGKYLPTVSIDPAPTVVLENFSEAVDWIASQLIL